MDNPDLIPLAERLRPAYLKDVLGQKQVLGKGKPLEVAIRAGKPHSIIFWGPPGVGKTTISRLVAEEFGARFYAISAVLAGVKEIRQAIDKAEVHRLSSRMPFILFVDEIHRFNKSQQDSLLPYVESGLFTLVGATTENPSFNVNNALLSRCAVYVLNSLTKEELSSLMDRACKFELNNLKVEDDARQILISSSDGDGRKLLNNLELAELAVRGEKKKIITAELIAEVLSSAIRRQDNFGEIFYDQISALHKSIRGSNPDGAVYWLCRMLESGVDPKYVSRRLIRMAWEDIGLADPRAMQITNEAALTYERLGSPEGELALAQAAIYLACAAKSNAGYLAYNQAMAFIKSDQTRPVPMHLRNAPTKLLKELGHGKEYRYAHNEPDAYAAGETYLPEGLEQMAFYNPTPRGLEHKIGEKLKFLQSLDEVAREGDAGASYNKD
jgi:putative ATPase